MTTRSRTRRTRWIVGSLMLVAVLGVAACEPLPPAPPGTTQKVFTCQPNASQAQTWTVPPGVFLATFDVSGAEGGLAILTVDQFAGGGFGGRALATRLVAPGSTVLVEVGCRGTSTIPSSGVCVAAAGGFPNGGPGGRALPNGRGGGGGGGMSAVITQTSTGQAGDVIIGGGGGGGGAHNAPGGDGGYPEGSPGTIGGPIVNPPGGVQPGAGGNQSDGGAGGMGSDGGWDGSAGRTAQFNGLGGAGGATSEEACDVNPSSGGGGGGGGFTGGGGGGGYALSFSLTQSGGGGGGGASSGPPGTQYANGVEHNNGRVVITYPG